MTNETLPPLPAPALAEAANGIISVSAIKDPTDAVVPDYEGASPGDQVKLMLVIGDKQWDYSKVLTSADVGKKIIFGIEKDHFSNGLAAGADARLRYSISRDGQIPGMSLELKVAIVR
ncbi:hypothetical protein [Pseudomonas moraviensis]|uniref:hypothetical protein n=1 Tax=Pseudomonas moraviensis TaxID=321662 RepID=UPI00105A4EF8|nr:hypothetical protein [Pseudomonas moraviensis]TDK57503.1 hypothetical protein E1508_00610 [Pseudomonas moraviensis]